MARANDPDSADSQFFICYDELPFLDGKYTVWGKVISGMNLIDRIIRRQRSKWSSFKQSNKNCNNKG